jgi:hypothetical protein
LGKVISELFGISTEERELETTKMISKDYRNKFKFLSNILINMSVVMEWSFCTWKYISKNAVVRSPRYHPQILTKEVLDLGALDWIDQTNWIGSIEHLD